MNWSSVDVDAQCKRTLILKRLHFVSGVPASMQKVMFKGKFSHLEIKLCTETLYDVHFL